MQPVDDSPFGIIAREPIPPDYEWEGAMNLRFAAGRRIIDGEGSITASGGHVRGNLTHDNRELLARAAHGPVPLGEQYEAGVLLPDERYAEATPTEANVHWRASLCMIDGTSLSNPFRPTERFSCRSLVEEGGSEHEPVYERLVYRAAHVGFPTHRTFLPDGWRADAIDGTFQDARLMLRNLNGDMDGRDIPQEDQYLAAVLAAAGFDDVQLYGLDLLVGFISGNAVQRTCREFYDSHGVLVRRIHEAGPQPTRGRTRMFHVQHAPFDSAALSVIGDGFVRMLRGSFPVGVILQHLHSATDGGTIEGALQSLLLGVHAAIEAWSRGFGRRNIVDREDWERIRPRLQSAVEDITKNLEPELAEAVRNKIASSNHTSTGFRERDIFRALAIEIGREDRAALNTRNELLHNGYFLRRFDELAPEAQQERVDFRPRLVNLLNQILLKACGFSGTIMEGSRFGPLRIESNYSPLFTVRGPHA